MLLILIIYDTINEYICIFIIYILYILHKYQIIMMFIFNSLTFIIITITKYQRTVDYK